MSIEDLEIEMDRDVSVGDIVREHQERGQADVLPALDAALAELPPVSRSLPADFPLVRLLQFLPDVRLKRAADAEAETALAIDVTTEQGLLAADAATARLRDHVALIEQCFDGDDDRPGPTKLAYALHKRLTGLRGEFCKAASAALSVLTKRIYDENARRRRIEEEAKRKAQEEADRQAREAAKRAAEEAKRVGAPKETVQALKQHAKVATAPPVASPAPAPALTNNTMVANWKARFRGSSPTAEPNPKTNQMNPAQRVQFLRLCLAVGQGQAPMALLEIDWAYANRRAASDKTTFDIPELEAFDEGGVRGKGSRR